MVPQRANITLNTEGEDWKRHEGTFSSKGNALHTVNVLGNRGICICHKFVGE